MLYAFDGVWGHISIPNCYPMVTKHRFRTILKLGPYVANGMLPLAILCTLSPSDQVIFCDVISKNIGTPPRSQIVIPLIQLFEIQKHDTFPSLTTTMFKFLLK